MTTSKKPTVHSIELKRIRMYHLKNQMEDTSQLNDTEIEELIEAYNTLHKEVTTFKEPQETLSNLKSDAYTSVPKVLDSAYIETIEKRLHAYMYLKKRQDVVRKEIAELEAGIVPYGLQDVRMTASYNAEPRGSSGGFHSSTETAALAVIDAIQDARNELAENSIRLRHIDKALAYLNSKQRRIIELLYFKELGDLNNAEVMAIMKTAKKTYYQAKKAALYNLAKALGII